jgi:long-subunit fatty acid transport protein
MQWDHALTERMQFQLGAEGYDTRDRDYYQIVVGGSYQYTPEVRLAANYRYRNQQSQTNDADSNRVSISLSWSPI